MMHFVNLTKNTVECSLCAQLRGVAVGGAGSNTVVYLVVFIKRM